MARNHPTRLKNHEDYGQPARGDDGIASLIATTITDGNITINALLTNPSTTAT
jgi:hypothetical protein